MTKDTKEQVSLDDWEDEFQAFRSQAETRDEEIKRERTARAEDGFETRTKWKPEIPDVNLNDEEIEAIFGDTMLDNGERTILEEWVKNGNVLIQGETFMGVIIETESQPYATEGQYSNSHNVAIKVTIPAGTTVVMPIGSQKAVALADGGTDRAPATERWGRKVEETVKGTLYTTMYKWDNNNQQAQTFNDSGLPKPRMEWKEWQAFKAQVRKNLGVEDDSQIFPLKCVFQRNHQGRRFQNQKGSTIVYKEARLTLQHINVPREEVQFELDATAQAE